MPIYEYVCQSCQHRFEVKQKFSDDPISSCARCGQAVNKIISAPAIMFKGSGWYVTDYSDKMKAPGQSSPAEPTNKSASGKEDQKTQPSTASSEPASPSSNTAAPSTRTGEAASKPSSTPTTPVTSTPSS
ncbi:MAG: zinc ribbon domain-containing protein [Nitrospirales bacterium]|nr:zinc ribbon domain-containing protein [Nitrospirales bacterium]